MIAAAEYHVWHIRQTGIWILPQLLVKNAQKCIYLEGNSRLSYYNSWGKKAEKSFLRMQLHLLFQFFLTFVSEPIVQLTCFFAHKLFSADLFYFPAPLLWHFNQQALRYAGSLFHSYTVLIRSFIHFLLFSYPAGFSSAWIFIVIKNFSFSSQDSVNNK